MREMTRGAFSRRTALAMISLAGLFFASIFACLPELSPLKEAAGVDAADETSSVPTSTCGNDFIDDDAGEVCDPGEAVATSTTCIDCLIQCTGGLVDRESGHCYFLANTSATYEQAAEACKGGHVVTVDSDREAELVDSITSLPYWVGYQTGVGGYRSVVPTEPGFTVDGGCAGCYVRGLTSANDGGECVVAADGGWSLSSCTGTTAATICEREPLGKRSFFCHLGATYCATTTFTVGKKRYLLYYVTSAARSANAAAAECAQHDGGRLVVFESREEREQIVQELLRLEVETPFSAWIGATSDGGAWTWDNGRPVDDGGLPSPWGTDQPSADAGRAFIRIGSAFLDSQLAQAEGDDTVVRAFICERPP
jgi:hypothetical protein